MGYLYLSMVPVAHIAAERRAWSGLETLAVGDCLDAMAAAVLARERNATQSRRNYSVWGQAGGYIVPPSLGLVPLYPPSQRCGLCQNFKQTTLTTRSYKILTNLYPPPTYENVPTRLLQ